MKVLVTGGAGYIGSHTICELIDGGFQVVSADNYDNSGPAALDGIERITGVRVENLEVDLADPEACASVFAAHPDIEAVIHFAGLKAVGESVENPLTYYRNNLNSTINLLDLGGQHQVKHFIFSSSCTVYGELDEVPVTEQSPVGNIQSPYGFTKYVGERIIADYIPTQSNFHGISLRYFNPVGAHPSANLGEDPLGPPQNLVPLICQTAAGMREKVTVFGSDYPTPDGSPIRDYVHVCDIAQAHVLALKYSIEHPDATLSEVFNLGTGRGMTVLEVIQAFETASGEQLNYEVGPRRPGDVAVIYSDSAKAERELGWKPAYSVEEMMSTAWKWQQRQLAVSGGGKAPSEES